MTVALAGLVTGAVLGALLTSRRLCFNAGVRRSVFEGEHFVLRAFTTAVAVQLALLPLLAAAGVAPLERSIDAGGPALLPVAQLVGGLVFGIGMALAGGCITGVMWKAGAGSVATAIAIAGFAIGELLTRGAGEEIVASLDDASRPREGSLHELLGVPFAPLAVGLALFALFALSRRSRDGLGPGAALGLVAGLAWVAADIADYGYGLGFVGAAEGTRTAVELGSDLPFQLYLALGVITGAALTMRGPLRRPDAPRMARALGGGVLMGVGGTVAHGCNIGHGVTGTALLSLGSVLAVTAMAAGAIATWRLALAGRPHVLGTERPEAVGW